MDAFHGLPLIIATSWSFYAYLKKKVPLAPLESLTAEVIVLAVPAFIVAWFVILIGTFVTIFAWFTVLVTGSMSEGMHHFLTMVHRYVVRTLAYTTLVVDAYPRWN